VDDRNIVFKTRIRVEASVMQSILESNGIQVFVYGESISNMYGIFSPTIGGISLGVPEEQAEAAAEIVRDFRRQQENGPPG